MSCFQSGVEGIAGQHDVKSRIYSYVQRMWWRVLPQCSIWSLVFTRLDYSSRGINLQGHTIRYSRVHVVGHNAQDSNCSILCMAAPHSHCSINLSDPIWLSMATLWWKPLICMGVIRDETEIWRLILKYGPRCLFLLDYFSEAYIPKLSLTSVRKGNE